MNETMKHITARVNERAARERSEELATLHAELDAKTAEAVRLREALERIYHLDSRDTLDGAVAMARMVLSETPATQREVARVRAMELVLEAVKVYLHFKKGLLTGAPFALAMQRQTPQNEKPEPLWKLEESITAYDQVVKP